MSDDLASPSFLSHISTLFPSTSTIQNPYYYIAGIVYAAHNSSSASISSFTHTDQSPHHRRKFKEALFKTSVLYGAPRMINTLLLLSKSESEDTETDPPRRDENLSIPELKERGVELFNSTYGETAEETRRMLERIHPDFDYYMMALVYGPVYGWMGVLNEVETSFAMIAAVVAVDAAVQVGWHVAGAKRHGASEAEVYGVVKIAEAVRARISELRK